MSPAEIRKWHKNPRSKKASFASTRARLPQLAKLKAKPTSKWTAADCKFAKRVVAFNKRMDGMRKKHGCTEKIDVSLRNWGRRACKINNGLHAAGSQKLTPGAYTFAWHCPSPPPEHTKQAYEETGFDLIDYITEHAEDITPAEFARAVGGWQNVREFWYGGFPSEGNLRADAKFMSNDWSVSWYKSHYPDGTPIVFHTSSGIEHVYELQPHLRGKVLASPRYIRRGSR
jgi:hypothetical protein